MLPGHWRWRELAFLRPIGASLPEADQLLVRQNADQYDGAHHCEIQGTRDSEQIDQVLQDLEQNRAQYDAHNRTFAAA